ncbi:MAG: ATP-binding protein [Aquabacterium sp.]|uniref:ATP-binding protein n=1 Tax=Aquabacterium sp. TaxID=1872578 RepID=UPI00271B04D4|nr:ATP-binding protein [Aquabacterium sp.]MDO9005433.1 ATP-binding protein [Aquabacterium sp.]
MSSPALSFSAQNAAPDLELEARVTNGRHQALHERLAFSMTFGIVTAAGVVAVLHDKVPHRLLGAWFAARLLIAITRMAHSHLRGPGRGVSGRHELRVYRLLAVLDSIAWSALGWAITPIHQLDIAVVSISVLIGVAALATCMLHVDFITAGLFIVPILLPNAVYAATRHDSLGWFCALATIGLMVALIMEARRSNLRIIELLRLRLQSEKVAQAQALALQQAQMLSDTKGRFLATMSHEMRTPLHGMLGLVRLLRQREQDAQAVHRLDLVRSSGEHLVSVINDILDFSSMEAGRLPLHERPFKLRALLEEVSATTTVSATENGLSLKVQIELNRDEFVMGDPVRIRQVLHNLLGNAVKFTSKGFVRLHATRDALSGEVRIQVQDTGIGIPSHEQARVFDAFHQAEGTYQRRFGGTGLGLAISRELCRAMGGDLDCRSEVGVGSLFTFNLPLPVVHAERTTQPGALDGAPAAGQAAWTEHMPEPHVLLVEDNPVNALVAQAELQLLGVKVTMLGNGREAVDWLAGQQADLVLMDCEMPVLDGFEATRQIRAREQLEGATPVSIVALTANAPDLCGDRCRDAGMNGQLSKPFRSQDLAQTLALHLPRAPQHA